MTVRYMAMKCTCGGGVIPFALYITRQDQLMIEGLCSVCMKKVQIVEGLRNMRIASKELRNMTQPDDDEADHNPEKKPQTDTDFLRELGITEDDDEAKNS